MLTTRTRKFSGGTLFRGVLRRVADQRGQGFLEYILVLMVVLGVVFVLARPVIQRLQTKFKTGLSGGVFKQDPTGSNFYYFPVK